jgi:hypothetical protein
MVPIPSECLEVNSADSLSASTLEMWFPPPSLVLYIAVSCATESFDHLMIARKPISIGSGNYIGGFLIYFDNSA